MKNLFLYETTSKKSVKVSPENSMMIPIKNMNNRVIAVLEISNITNELFGFDEEYFGIIVSNFCGQKIFQAISQKILREELARKNGLFYAFLDMCTSKDYFELTEKVKKWIREIFRYDKVRIGFLQNGKLF